jgi:NitT/TauT family transport system substrate-binding protein
MPNSPIKSPADLAGKKIAVTALTSASKILTQSVMTDRGVDTSKVTWVQMPLQNMEAALKHSEVDAIYQPQPWLQQAGQDLGAVPVFDIESGATIGIPLTGYVATRDWAKKFPKTLTAFQRGMLVATNAIHANPHSMLDAVVARHTNVSVDVLTLATLPTFSSILDPRPLQRVVDLMVKLGVISQKFEISTVIVPQQTQ